jgi:pantetheine-phosphate adenylyltransferase
MAAINDKLNTDLDTMFLTADDQYTYLSSRLLQELRHYGADLADFLPQELIPDFLEKMNA